jgi:hypothetical protein
MFYVLYPFVTYLLTLSRICGLTKLSARNDVDSNTAIRLISDVDMQTVGRKQQNLHPELQSLKQ